MTMINLYQAKTQLSRLVAAVEKQGERIVLCRNGSPVADLVPHAPVASNHFEPDPSLAGARFLGDPTAPLDIADWPEELR
jgi:antitoxin (DNA-binding transcriptional repressor) of toxin-antitoxin stability system